MVWRKRVSRLLLGISTSAFVFASLPAWQSSALAESITSALSSAYNNNPTLNAERAAVRAADEKLPQAKSGYRPTIAGTANLGVGRSSNAGGFRVGGFGITLSQNLFNGFKTVNNINTAKASIRASRERLRNTEQNTLFDAASAYVDVIQNQKILRIRRRNISFLREQLRAAQTRLDVGEGTRTDVAQASASLAAAQASLNAAQAQLDSSKAVYRQVVGREPSNLKTPKPLSKRLPKTMASALNIAKSEHPAIAATENLVDVALYQVKVSEGNLLPTLSLEGQTGRSYNSAALDSNTSNSSLTAQLRIPIYQGGAASSQVREGKEILGQRRIEVDASRDQVRSAVVSAWTQLEAARATLRANRAQTRAARLALEGVIEERQVGQRTTLDVLNAQQTLLNAQVLVVQAQRNEVAGSYALMSSIGRLTSRRLGLGVKHYSPKDHYVEVKDKWYGLRTPDGR